MVFDGFFLSFFSPVLTSHQWKRIALLGMSDIGCWCQLLLRSSNRPPSVEKKKKSAFFFFKQRRPIFGTVLVKWCQLTPMCFLLLNTDWSWPVGTSFPLQCAHFSISLDTDFPILSVMESKFFFSSPHLSCTFTSKSFFYILPWNRIWLCSRSSHGYILLINFKLPPLGSCIIIFQLNFIGSNEVIALHFFIDPNSQ